MGKKREEWCKHQDCKPLTQFKELCCGRLPEPDPHGGDFNTHRFCLKGAKDDGEWVFDLKVNKSDCYWFSLLFDAIKKDIKRLTICSACSNRRWVNGPGGHNEYLVPCRKCNPDGDKPEQRAEF